MTSEALHALLHEISNLPPEQRLEIIIARFEEQIEETERLRDELGDAWLNYPRFE